ncbi:MAG: hypothetical protein F4X26_02175 [Chloroflexi bacterium]|nr:hypothetical protein [Chloroflexota bacterium]
MSARSAGQTQRAPWLLVAAVTVAALVAAALAGLVLGRWAGERASAPTVVELVIEDPALAAADADEGWTTPGGFTGFGGLPALPGEVWRAAHVVASEPGRLVITSGGATTTIDYRAPSRLFEIAPIDAVEAGDVVVVRIVDGVAAAVLIVPPDVEEGGGSGSR